jgi:hypothetical protein
MTKKKYSNTVHARLWRAHKKNRGVRLTSDEVWQLMQDEALAKRGQMDVEGWEEGGWLEDNDMNCKGCPWYKTSNCSHCTGKDG